MLGLRARFGAALVLCAFALGAFAAPVTADVDVRWVDNDTRPGDGPARCDTARFRTIQAAINASGINDTVYVCPGTYAEQLTIDVRGLRVQARPSHGATIVPPDEIDLVEGMSALVRIAARDVDLVGFKLLFEGG